MAVTDQDRPAWRGPHQDGFSLLEILIASSILVLVAMMGVMHVVRTSQQVEWARDHAFAREKAVSILDELRSYVEGDDAEAAADLDAFDDGLGVSPVLTITTDPLLPGEFVVPDHPVSGNVRHLGEWRWYRRITVRPYDGVPMRDLRLVTVRVFRVLPGQDVPGDKLAEVSSAIRTIGDAYPTTQVYDVYLLAMENAPGWWVHMDAIQPFIEATLMDLQGRNRGLVFRSHWITRLGFGRDEEYAPYTNEARASTDPTPWTYVYPGRLPAGEAALRYYVPGRMGCRLNLDGETEPILVNDLEPTEPWTDADGDGEYDRSETYIDVNGSGAWDVGNPVPYAVADVHNHCMRWPEARARQDARIAAGVDDAGEPSWRLLLDQMVAEPHRFHNAILINLHGELLPMPPARNVSDAAKDPETRPGWRVVTHPERLRPRRVSGDDALSDAPRFRVHVYKTEFLDTEVVTTQEEPYVDADHSGAWEPGEGFTDWNGNGTWDAGLPISIVIADGDLTWAPNDPTAPSLRVQCLAGGVDADGNGTAEAYEDWRDAALLPESFTDSNADGVRQVAEPWLDLDGDGSRGPLEPFQELDGDGSFTAVTEALADANGNGRLDRNRPAEPYTDVNGNGSWDAAEPYWDENGDGQWTPPSAPMLPWLPWSPADYGDAGRTALYIERYGEPFLDLDGDAAYTPAEPLVDCDGDGVRDGGFERGEMWYELQTLASPTRSVLLLHGTPLETPHETASGRGLPPDWRLYDLDHVPCPTPATASGTDRFERDLYDTADVPKNTARWTIELPLPAVRQAFETAPGAHDGDGADRLITVVTRLGRDLTTGSMWPTRRAPQNRSVTYAYFYGDPETVPFSERYQFQGDPRHSPYADTDATGTTAANGYNWYFEDLGSEQDAWRAFDSNRLRDGWKACGSGHDVPRILSWLRTAITRSESVYTTLSGFSYYYLTLGGDVGYDDANGFPDSIPMDGTSFGIAGAVHENTFTDESGTVGIRGSIKLVRSNDGGLQGIRLGGPWWSKPWLGELFQDTAYAAQWKPWGNLRAATSTNAAEYHLVPRGDVPASQQPRGTRLVNLYARLKEEGATSLLNVGTSASSTFHHQYENDATGQLVDDGFQLSQNYNFPLPSVAGISRPWGLSTHADGDVGDEFDFTDAYPRCSASLVARFYDHENGQTGSGLVRLAAPGMNPTAGFLVVNGIDRTLESGSAFIARYSLLSLLHGFLAAGEPGLPTRVRQLPRVEIVGPTLVTELRDPATIDVRWSTEWTRWDGRPYTASYASDFAETESDLVYVLMYSSDGGRTWLNMRDGSDAEPGSMPWLDGVGPDPARTQGDLQAGAEEAWTWSTPSDAFPEGSYLIRIECYRATESLHFAHHQEKIYVER